MIQTIPGLALLALFYPLLLALSALTHESVRLFLPRPGFPAGAVGADALCDAADPAQSGDARWHGLDPAVLMAAKGVGMTPRQSLFKVELPLAAPLILAGIRTATVWVVGITTLSTPIGQTSLGNYIFTGLQTENWVFVLFGCVAAAALALVLDSSAGAGGIGLARRSRPRLALAGLGLVGGDPGRAGAGLMPRPIAHGMVIGAKNFDEQYILAAGDGPTG